MRFFCIKGIISLKKSNNDPKLFNGIVNVHIWTVILWKWWSKMFSTEEDSIWLQHLFYEIYDVLEVDILWLDMY